MAVYIVRPQDTLVESRLTLTTVKTDSESREKQIEEVVALRSEDEIFRQTREYISEAVTARPRTAALAEASGARSRTAAVHEPRVRESLVTGTIVVDMDDDAAAQMQQELPDVLVLRDQPFELIPPNRATSATNDQHVEDLDLWHLEAIGLTAARSNGFRGTGSGITIAELDTGIDPTHPELHGKVTEAFTFDARPGVWTVNEITPSIDTDGHGTHVAGLMCGDNVGVAPEARVINGVMIPGGRGNLSDFILALEWALNRTDVQILNMSAGIPGYLPEMQQLVVDIRAVGVLPVFATGNEGRNRTRSPGNYRDPISVGASNRGERVASFSSSGTLTADNHQYVVPDIVAPGQEVYSSVMDGGYEAWDGTSMATPIVSGVAALILEKDPNLTIPELEDVILDTCVDLKRPVERQGCGLVQVEAAI
jgi:subtilisin family serine protease